MTDENPGTITLDELKGWVDRHLERQPKLPCRVYEMTARVQQIFKEQVAYNTGFLLYLQQRLALAVGRSVLGDVITVGRPLPKIAGVRPSEGLAIEVRWQGGGTETVDLSPAVRDFKAYRCLREDRELFETVQVGEFGGSIEWGGGIVDMAASTVERLAAAGMARLGNDREADEVRRGM